MTNEDIQIISDLIRNGIAPLAQRMDTMETEMRELNLRQSALELKTDKVLGAMADLLKTAVDTQKDTRALLEIARGTQDQIVAGQAAMVAKLIDHERRITNLEKKVG